MGYYGAWFQALFCQPPKCLGVQLKPFSYAHFEMLKEFGSPYLIEGYPAEREDLIFAVSVCSRTWEQLGIDFFDKLNLFSVARLSWKSRKKQFAFHDAQMRQYIKDYTFLPDVWNTESERASKPYNAPTSYHVTRHLRQHEGFDESKSWNCPINRARCYLLDWQESEGYSEPVGEGEELEMKVRAS